jgi:hypothetical protein
LPDLIVQVWTRKVQMSKDEWRAIGAVRRLPDEERPSEAPNLVALRPSQCAYTAVFRLHWQDDRLHVSLCEEACFSLLGIPRRPTRLLARLDEGHPLRLRLNGRHASTSGQTYTLAEYVLLVGTASLEEKFINLDEDLL